jgi:putative ABC transport system permease protein
MIARIAVRSAAHNRGSVLATGIVALVGAVLAAAMAGVLGTGLAATTAEADRPFLTQFAVILGGWILCIVVFAVVSTVAVGLEARTEETRGLRLVGATPAQIRRLIALESAAVGVVAAVPGAAIGYLVGAVIVGLVRGTGLIATTTAYAPGFGWPLLAACLITLSCIAGGHLGSKAAATRGPVDAPATARVRPRSVRARRITGVIALVLGPASSSTSLAMDPHGVYATAATGPGCVLVAVGIALLSAETLALAEAIGRMFAGRSPAASTHLAKINLRREPARVRPVVMFLTLLVGIAAGTLAMQSIENTADRGTSGTGPVIASINYVVVALIAAFMAIALINNVVASVARRRPEFTTMALLGATAPQIRRMLLREVTVALITAAIAGSLGAAVAVLPFAIAKTGTPSPALTPVPYLIAVLPAAALALAVTALSARAATARVRPAG